MVRRRRMNLSSNVLRGLDGMQQFTSLHTLHIGFNSIADSRQLLCLPPTITSLQLQGNPCCSCCCARTATLSRCTGIKTLDGLHVMQWEVSAATSAVDLQVSLSHVLVGVSVLCRAVAAAAAQLAVNAEFVRHFGRQRYQQQQQQQETVIILGLSAVRSIFSGLIDAADALRADGSSSSSSSGGGSGSGMALAAIRTLSSLPHMDLLLESGGRPPVHPNQLAVQPLYALLCCLAARRLVPSIAVQAVDMQALVSSRAGGCKA
jgi:hypothetical protein